MNTLHEHAVAMLNAVDEQSKIPGTVFRRCAWIVKDGETYSMCAGGAWYAQTYGRMSIPPYFCNSLKRLETRWR